MQLSTSLLALLAAGSSVVSASPRYQPQVAPRQAPPRGRIPASVTAMLNKLPANAQEPLDFFPKDFGVQRGTPLGDKSADCRGIKPNGDPIGIPCSCPPDVDDPTFRAGVKIGLNLGFFPLPDPENNVTGKAVPITITQWNNNGQVGDAALQTFRNTVMTIALQSLTGVEGKGCPAVSVPALKSVSG